MLRIPIARLLLGLVPRDDDDEAVCKLARDRHEGVCKFTQDCL